MKKIKKKLLKAMLYITIWGMWTSLMIFGFMTATTLN